MAYLVWSLQLGGRLNKSDYRCFGAWTLGGEMRRAAGLNAGINSRSVYPGCGEMRDAGEDNCHAAALCRRFVVPSFGQLVETVGNKC